jgi:glycyl-tRNA synthetase
MPAGMGPAADIVVAGWSVLRRPARTHQTTPTASRMETSMAARSDRMDAIVSLSKRRGFVYPSSEIYGGLRASWDYGPLGVELKNNIKRLWWRSMVMERDDIVGLDSSVILAREVWEASGHVTEFVDPLTECVSCHKRFRTDHLIEAYEAKHGHPPEHGLAGLTCPNCGNKGTFTEPRMFSGLLRTYLGPVEDESGLAYLRPETAQGIFINYKNVLQSSRKKLPFGIGQIGKSFRNEITPGNFIFRTREFEQMEMEFFVRPGADEDWHQTWIDTRFAWYSDLGIRKENLRLFEHPKEKLAHYSKRTVDVEYRFGFQGTEWGELEGIANRTDFDLTTHGRASGVDMSYLDQESGERFIPFVIEPAAGVDRAALVFLLDGYTEDEAPDAKGNLEKRTVLRLDPRVAPVKAAVLPLSRNADLSPLARDLAAVLRKRWNTDFDDASAIGRRYRRQDEIGTPYCVTVDFDTLDDQAVTVRERDSMRQERVSIDQLETYLGERLPYF